MVSVKTSHQIRPRHLDLDGVRRTFPSALDIDHDDCHTIFERTLKFACACAAEARPELTSSRMMAIARFDIGIEAVYATTL